LYSPRMFLLMLVCVSWSAPSVHAQPDENGIYLPRTVSTMTEVLDVVDIITLGVTLQAPVDLKFDRFDVSYLLPLINHLDFNVIGHGRSATLFPQHMIEYILRQLERNEPLAEIGTSLIDEFRQLELTALQEQNRQLEEQRQKQQPKSMMEPLRVNIGGFFVSEIEQHQEPDGAWFTLVEINQLRLFFSALINPSAQKNRVSFLAEWNPVP